MVKIKQKRFKAKYVNIVVMGNRKPSIAIELPDAKMLKEIENMMLKRYSDRDGPYLTVKSMAGVVLFRKE